MTYWEEQVTLPEFRLELTSSEATNVFLRGFNISAEKVRAVKLETQTDGSRTVTWYCDFSYYGKIIIVAITIIGAYSTRTEEGPSTLFRHIRAFRFTNISNSKLSKLVRSNSFLIEKE